MTRVLVISSTRIGDAILSSGLIAHIMKTWPDARLTLALGPLAAPLFRAVPGLERLIVMAKRKGGGHWVSLWRQTASQSWDLVVDLRGSRTSWFLRAKTRRIAGRPRLDRHKVREAADVLKLSEPAAPRVWLDEEAIAAADQALSGAADFIAVSPAASSPFKVWPADRFAQTCRALTEQGGPAAGAPIVLFGGPGDKPVSAALASHMSDRTVIDLTGALDLLAVAACLTRARCFLGNDSGLMHLSAAVGAPTLGLFGPTDERLYAPWGPWGRTVRAGEAADAAARRTLRHAEASLMADLTVEKVTAAATALLAETRDKERAHVGSV